MTVLLYNHIARLKTSWNTAFLYTASQPLSIPIYLSPFHPRACQSRNTINPWWSTTTCIQLVPKEKGAINHSTFAIPVQKPTWKGWWTSTCNSFSSLLWESKIQESQEITYDLSEKNLFWSFLNLEIGSRKIDLSKKENLNFIPKTKSGHLC